jgi:hypothetical protein
MPTARRAHASHTTIDSPFTIDASLTPVRWRLVSSSS